MELPRKKLEILGYAFIFTLAILGQYFARTDLAFFEGTYVREDSFIEWLQFTGLFFGFLVCLYRMIILKPFRSWTFLLGLALLAFLFFFGAAEEISWGQRIFDFKTPEWFMAHNTQGEFNLHNLKFGNFKVNRIIFGTVLGIVIAFYFLILPLLYKKMKKLKDFADGFAIPVPKLYHIIAYILLAIIAKSIPSPKKGEILEFGGIWIFILMIFEPYNREFFSRKLKPIHETPPPQS
ncbi:MAG: hypothetical protein CO099_02010 [Bdellovibrio sp. CG_4_9_14_3_um_filter_39_7]|nr:MAG: hypothetical protein CO099_02010 [Bdellovibrio sp. CG_4_9_14_3_um_filter_39_7]